MKKLFFLLPVFWAVSLLAQDQTVPVVSIGPIRKTLAAGGRDTVIVSLPPFEGLANVSCGVAAGMAKYDSVQSFPNGRWSCNPPKAVSWNGYIRVSVRVIAGTASDSLKATVFPVNSNGYLCGSGATYAFGSASTVANPGTATLTNSSAITLDPCKAIALDIQNSNTGGATRYEFYFDIW